MALRRPAALAASLAAAALMVGGLAACGSDETAADTVATTAATAGTTATAAGTTTAADTTAGTTDKVGGTATCDAASLVEAAQGADPNVTGLDDPNAFKCADGWAYASVDTGSGSDQYAVVVVFEAEGQFWIPKDRAEVCTAPGNQVPASLYEMACETD